MKTKTFSKTDKGRQRRAMRRNKAALRDLALQAAFRAPRGDPERWREYKRHNALVISLEESRA